MPSQSPAAAAWPPPETPAWMCDAQGVRPVLIHRRTGDTCKISIKNGIRVRDPRTGALEKQWSLSVVTAPFANLFATEDAARAVWQSRKLLKAA